MSSSRSHVAVPARPGGDARRGERGYNLLELLMSMTMATIIFMSVITLYTFQAESVTSQSHVLTSTRSAQFAMEHLRRDLTALGSNATANSHIDDLVCPKPAILLRALTVGIDEGFVYEETVNPFMRRTALTLFGSLDVKTRYETDSIAGKVVTLVDDGTLPTTEALWLDTFTTDRFLRLSTADGKSMYFAITATSFSARTVTLVSEPPQIEGAQRCGYQATGAGLMVDVQGLVRYRIIADTRPTARKDSNSQPVDTLLVRERLEVDGVTVRGALPLSENIIEIGLFDAFFDANPAPDATDPDHRYFVEDMAKADGTGPLGHSLAARPEALRSVTVKLSVRADEHQRDLMHKPRAHKNNPLFTYKLDANLSGSAQVTTIGSRVTMPALISRNL